LYNQFQNEKIGLILRQYLIKNKEKQSDRTIFSLIVWHIYWWYI